MLRYAAPMTASALLRLPALCSVWACSVLACSVAALSACAPPAKADLHVHTASKTTALTTSVADFLTAEGATPKKVVFDGGLTLVGVKHPQTLPANRKLPITLYWQVASSVASTPKVFVHGQIEGAHLNQAQGDHPLVAKGFDVAAVPAGDVLQDSFTLSVPKWFPADKVQVRFGLYEGKKRWDVDEGGHDDNRVHLGDIAIDGGQPALPTAKVKRTTAPIALDGVLDEADWASAERVGPFISYDGKRRMKNKTYARLLYDNAFLYVAFECDDDDIHTPYKKRDDPLYKSEAVEIFIDADGDQDEYVELQAAPNDALFDAAFKGGPRKNFDTSYNADYEAKAKLDGTFNDNSDQDKGWVSEWRIRIDSLKDIPAAPKAGTTWKANLFRLDRKRRGQKRVGNEASAWSSPYSGDFHNLKRFGTLVFE